MRIPNLEVGIYYAINPSNTQGHAKGCVILSYRAGTAESEYRKQLFMHDYNDQSTSAFSSFSFATQPIYV